MTEVQKTLADLFAQGVELKEFKPCAFIIEGLDTLLYLEKDCSYTSTPVPGSNISLLVDNSEPRKIVGVEIPCFSAVTKGVLKQSVAAA